jgi:hypothetical protein
MTIPNTTYRVYVEKLGASDPGTFIGNEGEIFYDPNVATLKLSDGYTSGGIPIGGDSTPASYNVWVEQFVSSDPATSNPSLATSVEYDDDGNVIALFYNNMSDIEEQHTSVAKFDSAGLKQWEVKFDGGDYTNGWGLAVDNKKGYIYVSGKLDTASLLSCLNAVSGAIVWSKVYNFAEDSNAPVVDVLSNGDPVIVGYNLNGEEDNQLSVTRISATTGDVIWSKGLNGIGDERAIGMAVGRNDEIVAVGTMDQINEGSDTEDHILVAKYDGNGTLTWQKAVLFDSNYNCYGTDADIDSAGNIYVCGSYERVVSGIGTSKAMSLFKMDSDGDKQWSRRVVGNYSDFTSSIVVGADNHLYLSGITGVTTNSEYDWVLAKYNLNGGVVWQRLIDNTEESTFPPSFFNEYIGGSNLAVNNGYIAAAGGIGTVGQSKAVVAQFDTGGALWKSGPWQYVGIGFTGTLDSTASNIVVSDANKEDVVIEVTTELPSPGTSVEVDDSLLDSSTSNYLVGTLYNSINDEYPNVGRYISTANNSYANAIPISVTKDIVFLSPLNGGRASYKVNVDGRYDGQQIKFLPKYLAGTTGVAVTSIYVYTDKLYSTTGAGVSGPFPWYPFRNYTSDGLATLTWNAEENCWVPSPYLYN